MFLDLNQPIFSLRKFSPPYHFNPLQGLSEVLLVYGIDHAKQKISLNIILDPSLKSGKYIIIC